MWLTLSRSLRKVLIARRSPAAVQPEERAQLTILYNQGSGQYQVEQTLAPDEQMALDFGKLIRDQVPDKNGHTLPPDLTFGTYRILDLTDGAAGGLYEGKIILDKTFGHAAYGCAICCGPEVAVMGYYPLDVPTGGWDVQEVLASNSCGGGQQNVTGDFPTWWTDNTAIATATGSKINGISAGTTNHHAQSVEMYWGYREYYQLCPKTQETSTAPTNVTPKISQNQNLWYFNGNPTPSGFTLGSTSATLTASGGGSGTYGWAVTSGASIASLQGTVSGENVTSVTINSIGYSTSLNDVTVQLQLEPSDGSASVQTSYSLSVDSPYKLVSGGSTTNRGVTGSCSLVPAAGGTSGFQSLVPYTIISFLGTPITNINVTENFSNIQPVYTNENWPYIAGTATTQTGNFVDDICTDSNLTPLPLPPQSPLSSVQVDQAFQTWNVGGGANSAGLTVQTDTIRRYVDHGLHAAIVSPTR